MNKTIISERGDKDIIAAVNRHSEFMVNPACGLRTQHTESYTSLRARTDAYKLSFLPRSIRDWNSLPREIITIQNPDA